MRRLLRTPGWKTAKGSSHIMTTSARFVLHVEYWKCIVFCKRSCGLVHASGFTTARLNSGTGVGLSQPGWRSLPLQLVWWNQTQWCGKSDPELPLSQNGLRVLGAPIGHPMYIVDQLASKSVEHELLFQRIPAVEDLQAAWLLLFCGATRANFWLRMIQPDLSLPFAERHDDRVWDCLASLLHVPAQLPHARTTAPMPLSKGGWVWVALCAPGMRLTMRVGLTVCRW